MPAPEHDPPPHPPPLLTEQQILFLAYQGHLHLQLDPSLADLYRRLSLACIVFFGEPTTTKSEEYPATQGTEKGYTLVAEEKEYLTFRHATRSNWQEVEALAREVWQKTAALLYRVLSDLGVAMDLPHDAWNPVLDGCLSMPSSLDDPTPTLLRIFRYFPESGTAESHTDTGLLTLCVGSGKGLQVAVQDDDGDAHDGPKWRDVEGPTILVGQVLRILSGNRLRAGLHRVVGNPEGRSSVVFALRPSLRHDTVALAAFGGERIMNIRSIWGGIRGSRFNVNAQKEVRESQKQALAAKTVFSSNS